MIKFSLPDFNDFLLPNLIIAKLSKELPELFNDDLVIDGIYGCFPGCIANGGRSVIGERYSYDRIARTIDRINSLGIATRLTLTNIFIKPEEFEDEYLNTILKAGEGKNVEVIVYSDELADYIKSRYNYKQTLSTTRPLDGVDELNKMLERYDMVVLDYNHNKDDEFLKKVKNPAKLEIMPNELCEINCPYRKQHYEFTSRMQHDNFIPDKPFSCKSNSEKPGYTKRMAESPTLLSNDDIKRLNSVYGIDHFKLVGRNLAKYMNKETYSYYLFRPETADTVYRIINEQLGRKS